MYKIKTDIGLTDLNYVVMMIGEIRSIRKKSLTWTQKLSDQLNLRSTRSQKLIFTKLRRN